MSSFCTYRSHRCPPGVAQGFTLIELVVAITVFAILLAFGIPEFIDFLKNREVQSAAESVQNDIRRAQIEAMKRNLPTEFVLTSATVSMSPPTLTPAINSTSGRNWILRVPSNASLAQPTAQLLAAHNASDGFPNGRVQLRQGANPLRFSALGRTANSAGTPLNVDTIFRVQHASGGARNLCVVISTSGAIQICDGALTSGVLGACSPAVQPLCL